MKGREKCSRSGTVKVTRVTSNLKTALISKLEQTSKKTKIEKPVDDGIEGSEHAG